MQKPRQGPQQSQPPMPVPRSRLIQARTDHRWSQQDLAERIGTTHLNVSRWERGLTKPGPYFRRQLCQLFGKTEEELDLTGIVPPLPSAGEKSAAITQQQASPHAAPLSQPPGDEMNTMATSAAHSFASSATAREAVYDPAIPLLPAVPLVGRDAEMTCLRQRLHIGGNVALTALNGLPGVGKTALAIALAHDQAIRAHFRDGVLWAGLGPQPSIAGVLSRWGTLLGISSAEMAALTSHEAWALSLRTAIGSRCMLLVIDDAWQIEDALTLKVGSANCAHLITTRFPGIAAHIAFDGATTIRELGEEESMALLRRLAPGVVDYEAQRAHDLIQAVGGLPLALTLIGNYLRKQLYQNQQRRITTALERLANAEVRLHLGEPHGPAEKHSSLSSDTHLSLQSVFAVTDQQLSASARAALYALSVFPPKPNSFSEEAALAVADCTVETLDMLSDFGLLESSSEGRYTLHQTIADYARLHYHERAAQERLIAYVVAYLQAHRKDYELIERESATTLAALDMARDLNKDSQLVRGVTAYAPFLLSRGLYAVAEQWLQQAHEVAIAQQDHRGIAGVLLYLGQIAQKQGDFAQAEVTFQEGLALARQCRESGLISDFLSDLGELTWRRGDYVRAEGYLKEGLNLARQIEDHASICITLRILGSIASRQGDYVQSETFLQEALNLARQIGDREQTCAVLTNLGVTSGEQGHHSQAEEYLKDGLELARQLGQQDLICALLGNLGEAEVAQEKHTQAKAFFQEGLELARQIGRREWVSVLSINLGLATRKQGDYVLAELHLQEALLLAQQLSIPQITANALYEYGNLCLDRQQLEAAESAFREMLAITPENGQDLITLARYGIARTIAAKGDACEAQRLGEASVVTLEAMGHRYSKEARDWLNFVTSRVEGGFEEQ